MSTQSVKGPPSIRGNRRRKATLHFDLNSAPQGENREQEGPSTQAGPTQSSQPRQHESPAIPLIDVEAIDDDVVESSRTAFAEAKNNRRNRIRRVVVDVESEEHNRGAHNNQKRRRTVPNQNNINCEFFINLENSVNPKSDRVVELPPPPPPPPPKEVTFSCPICMGSMVEEMSTKCGHIFCKGCIKAAIAVQAKCPTCRKRVTSKELFRVFLPAMSNL